MITHICKACETSVEVARVDITTIQGGPRFIWGMWEKCTGCGSTAQPLALIEANDPRLGRGRWGDA